MKISGMKDNFEENTFSFYVSSASIVNLDQGRFPLSKYTSI